MVQNAMNKIKERLYNFYLKYNPAFFSAVIAGFAAHGYAFTNKLLNNDDVAYLFDKGVTISSGRWGLEIIRLVLPDYSMPWLWGLLSICLIGLGVCIIADVFEIDSARLQILLGALVVTFPSITSSFCYMFTSSAYAVGFLTTVFAGYFAIRHKKLWWLCSSLCIIFAVSVYQAFLPLAISLLVIFLIKRCLCDGDAAEDIFRQGVSFVILLIASFAVYLLITFAVMKLTGNVLNQYATKPMRGFSLFNLIRPYMAFVNEFLRRDKSLVVSHASKYAHLLIAAAMIWITLRKSSKKRAIRDWLLLLFLFGVYPLAVNLLDMVFTSVVIHTLVLYSFTTVYILMMLYVAKADNDGMKILPRVMKLCLCFIIASNIVFANKVYLRLQLEYEEAHAVYTSVITRVQALEGYDEDKKLVIVGALNRPIVTDGYIDLPLFIGVPYALGDTNQKENFVRYYLGYAPEWGNEDDIKAVSESEEFSRMPIYPYNGSIAIIDDYVVVKFSDPIPEFD